MVAGKVEQDNVTSVAVNIAMQSPRLAKIPMPTGDTVSVYYKYLHCTILFQVDMYQIPPLITTSRRPRKVWLALITTNVLRSQPTCAPPAAAVQFFQPPHHTRSAQGDDGTGAKAHLGYPPNPNQVGRPEDTIQFSARRRGRPGQSVL